jgi:RNA polymerase sigma-70 factor (ECF subfamily)
VNMSDEPREDLDDRELAARVADGDASAFELIVQRHHTRVWRIASCRLQDAAVVDDVVQDTFIRAWRGLPSFRGDCSLRAWLTRICINCCIDEWHRRRGAVTVPFDATRELLATDDVIEDLVTNIDLGRALLAHLPEDERDAFVLVHILGHSAVAAAAEVKAPPTTVRSRVERARRRMRSALADKEGVEREHTGRGEDVVARVVGIPPGSTLPAATATPDHGVEAMSWGMES